MITLTRYQARRLRQVFRRDVLDLPRCGPVPPLSCSCDSDSALLRVRYEDDDLAVECVVPGVFPTGTPVCLPLDALIEIEGPDDTPVVIETLAPGRTVVSWEVGGVPLAREFACAPRPGAAAAATASVSGGTFPRIAPSLLVALGAAGEVAGPGRPGQVALSGATGTIRAAAAGPRRLVWRGLPLPSGVRGTLRATTVFACAALPRTQPLAVATTGSWLIVRAGAWTIAGAIHGELALAPGCTPAVTGGPARSLLRLGRTDAAHLLAALRPGPACLDERTSAVVVALSDRVVLQASVDGEGEARLVPLDGVAASGPPCRAVMPRADWLRALRFGCLEFRFGPPGAPVVASAGLLTYAFPDLSVLAPAAAATAAAPAVCPALT